MFNIPLVEGSIYQGQGIQCNMVGGQNTMCMCVKTRWVGGSKYHRQGVKNHWQGVNIPGMQSKYHEQVDQNTMDRGPIYHGKGVKKPRIGGQHTIGRGSIYQEQESKYHGQGDQNTIGRGFDIPWVRIKIPWIGGSAYHGQGGQNTMSRWIDIPWVGVNILQIGQNTRDVESKYHEQVDQNAMVRGVKIA